MRQREQVIDNVSDVRAGDIVTIRTTYPNGTMVEVTGQAERADDGSHVVKIANGEGRIVRNTTHVMRDGSGDALQLVKKIRRIVIEPDIPHVNGSIIWTLGPGSHVETKRILINGVWRLLSLVGESEGGARMGHNWKWQMFTAATHDEPDQDAWIAYADECDECGERDGCWC